MKGGSMGKITVDIILKITEVVTGVVIAVTEIFKGRTKDDSSGSSKEK
jgi:hypothetical protein